MGWFDFFRKKQVKPAPGFQERRLLPRWQINGGAHIRWEGRSEEVPCQVKNLNLKGFAVRLEDVIPQGCTKITLRFSSEYVFNVEVAVLWHSQVIEQGRQQNLAINNYGLKFTKIRDTDKEKIYKMIRDDFPEMLQEHTI